MLEVSLTLISIGIAVLAYQSQKQKDRKEEREKIREAEERRDFVIGKWKFLKTLNENLISRITDYIQANNASDMLIGDGFSLGIALEKIEAVKRELLNDENFDAMQVLEKHPKITVENLLTQLEVQIAAHAQCLTYIELLGESNL